MSSSSQALEYLEQQPLKTHTKLYEQPSTVLAIFRCMLPHLAKTLVMAMLYMTGPFPADDLDAWFRADGKKDKGKALTVLDRLHIMTTAVAVAVTGARTTTYGLAPRFATSLREALTGGGSHRSFGVPASTTGAERVTVHFLEQYATKQWENILFYMVGSTVGLAGGGEGVGGEVGEGTKALLKMGEFIHIAGRNVRITKKGFEFVLRDTNAQVWSLLIVYLQNAPALGMSETDVLSFLFLLGSLSIGQDYTTSTLSPTQLQMLEDLSAFGIVYRPSSTSPSFYPTRLAVTLTSDSGSLQQRSTTTTTTPKETRGSATEKGFIIIETNYRLYAYTNSLLSIAILSLFTKLTTRFPNLVSGKLTRDSISRAVKLGISSAQIISYLQAHAHPQMMRNTTILPPTVMDQIRLWEYEGERVETTSGYVMKEFESEKEYRDLVEYAESLGVLVWRSDARRCFFVDQIDQIGTYLQRKKK
ncbi:RNA polymerase II transcription factor-like protein B subunit 2 [Lophiotrema nucula]|uniref:RNA polymerase II transcription factor B subunit 2 n=1 Tax=Lophiotrema nucula TaxID=690887 RepID=A0A6A5Z8Y2_9PLEO|nr:RNA polymerase II transcription factor-like protein B subunit 2 [Lophiotrema nucula]